MITPGRICIVQLNRIGDMILVTPILRALHERFPDAELHLLAGKHNAAVVEDHPLVHATHVYAKRPSDTVRLLRELRRQRFDVWIDPKGHPSTESSVFARLSAAPIRIGLNPGGKGPFTHPVPAETDLPGSHLADRGLGALEHLGIEGAERRPVLYTTPGSDDRLEEYLRTRGIGDYDLVNVSARGHDRAWPVENWIDLLRRVDRGPYLISGVPRDRGEIDRIVSEIPGEAYYCESPGIVDVFSLVSRSRQVLTVDTSIVHIASAFNKPTVALYVNLPLFFGSYAPLSDHHRAVMHPEEGSFVSRIPVEMVEEAIRELEAEVGG